MVRVLVPEAWAALASMREGRPTPQISPTTALTRTLRPSHPAEKRGGIPSSAPLSSNPPTDRAFPSIASQSRERVEFLSLLPTQRYAVITDQISMLRMRASPSDSQGGTACHAT